LNPMRKDYTVNIQKLEPFNFWTSL
jgi:hypothetical protein